MKVSNTYHQFTEQTTWEATCATTMEEGIPTSSTFTSISSHTLRNYTTGLRINMRLVIHRNMHYTLHVFQKLEGYPVPRWKRTIRSTWVLILLSINDNHPSRRNGLAELPRLLIKSWRLWRRTLHRCLGIIWVAILGSMGRTRGQNIL